MAKAVGIDLGTTNSVVAVYEGGHRPARHAVKVQAPLERVRTLTADLQQLLHGLPAATSGPGSGGAAPPGATGAGGDDVIDAKFTNG